MTIRRAIRISLWSVGALMVLLIVTVCGVFIYGNTDAGRAAIPQLVARLTGGTVRLSGLSGDFPRHLMLERIELADDQGIWLWASDIRIDWNPWVYLTRGLSVQDLRAARLAMDRVPHSKPAPPGKSETSIPRIEVDHLAVARADLGASLTGLPASLKVDGRALLRDLGDMSFDVHAQRIDGDGDYFAHYAFDRKSMQATLKLHEPANGPLANLASVPGLGALDAEGTLTGARTAETLQLSLTAGTLKGGARGTLNLEDLSANLSFDFESEHLQPRTDLAVAHALLRGRWQGSLKGLNADAHLEAQQLAVPGGAGASAVNLEFTARQGAARLTGSIAGLRVPGPAPALLSDAPLSVDAALRLDQETRPLNLSVTHRLFAWRSQLDTRDGARGKFDLKLHDLLPLAAIAGQRVAGNADLSGTIDAKPFNTQLKLGADLNLQRNTESWQPLLGDHAHLDLSGSLAGEDVTVDSLKVAGRVLALGASGTLAKKTLKARWSLDLSDLAAASSALVGRLSASGSVQGPLGALAIEADADALVGVHGTPPGALSAKVRLHDLPNAPAGEIEAHGTLDEAPLAARIDLTTQQGVLRTIVRQGQWKSAQFEGEVATSLGAGTSSGEVKAHIEQLQDLKRLIGTELGGSVAADLKFSPGLGRTRLALEMDATNLKSGDVAGNVHLAGEGFADGFPLQIDVKLPDWRGSPVALSSTLRLDFAARRVELATLETRIHEQPLKLLEPARIDFANGLSVDKLRLGSNKAELSFQGALLPEAALKVSLSKVGAELINAFVPNLLSAGNIEAHADLHGALATPTGELELNATGVRFADDAAVGLPATNLHIAAQLQGSTAQVDAKLGAGEDVELTVQGRAPLDADGEVALDLKGKTSVRLLNPLLEAKGQHAEGWITIDAHVGGSVADPVIGGTARLAQGSWRDYGRGASLTNIEAELVGSQGAVQIKSLTASAAPGTVKATGSIGVLQPKVPVDIKIVAENAQPIVSKLVTSNLNAQLNVSGNARERLNVQGTLHLNRTMIGIPNGLPPNVAVLDVRRRGKKTPTPTAKPLIVALNIKVEAPQQILVQGRGLDAEMGGELRVSGTADAPQVSGGFDLQRGSFSLASTRLNFKSGRVGFDGRGLQNRIDPNLDFLAETQLSDGAVRLRISGYADAPQFEFSSDNNAAPDEIMAKLLFGQDPSKLSALQLAQVGAALASLSGVGGDSGPLAKLQHSLGLDRLSVGSAEGSRTGSTDTSGASINAGRYISRRVYIEARQSTTGVSQLEADVDIVKGLKLQTRLGNGTASVQGTTPENDPGSSIGLTYQFEY